MSSSSGGSTEWIEGSPFLTMARYVPWPRGWGVRASGSTKLEEIGRKSTPAGRYTIIYPIGTDDKERPILGIPISIYSSLYLMECRLREGSRLLSLRAIAKGIFS